MQQHRVELGIRQEGQRHGATVLFRAFKSRSGGQEKCAAVFRRPRNHFKQVNLGYNAARRTIMAQTDNPFLDGMAKAFTDAAGMAQGLRAEIDTFVRQRLERLVADMDFVPREEFEAVKAMAAKAREENEALAVRIAALEVKQG